MEKELEALMQAALGKVFVPLEASGRHVHITAGQAQILFGHNLTPDRPLSQQRAGHGERTQRGISECGGAGTGAKGCAGGDFPD